MRADRSWWWEDDGFRERRPAVFVRVYRRVGRWMRLLVCWLFGCKKSEVVAFEPVVFGAGASGAMCHGSEARCPRCGRTEWLQKSLVFPTKKHADVEDL